MTTQIKWDVPIRHGPPYQKIKDASITTGLSQFFLRNGCKSGFVPCLKSGGVYYINVPALLKKLDGQSERGEAG